ncbi:MAG TPA: hypothetical protein VEK82_09265 [Stellaceae bacterium]|nr:hypothetical protein [Stellaceae bacterium]
MKSAIAPIAVALSLLGLTSCYVPPAAPPPAPGPAYVAPAPVYVAPPPRIVRHCGPRRHWVRGHYNRAHRWIPGHCAWNR